MPDAFRGHFEFGLKYERLYFEFLQTQDAQDVWRYLDLSGHARYLRSVLRQTVEYEMAWSCRYQEPG